MFEKKTHVLVVEDDEEDWNLVKEFLGEVDGNSLALSWASNYDEGLRAIREDGVDVCLVDYRLGGRTGVEFLAEPVVRDSGVPAILMTGRGTPEVDQEGMDAGAVDFLAKDELSGPKLERALRYAAERKRREGLESQLRTLIGNVREIVSVLEPDRTLRYLSSSITRVLGFRPEDKKGVLALHEVHPEDQDEVERAFQSVLERPSGRIQLRYRVRHAAGGWRLLDTIAENHVENPDVRGVVVCSSDITDYVEGEKRIRFQAGLLDAVGQTVIAADPAGAITYLNPAAEELHGLKEDSALGTSVWELYDLGPERDFSGEVQDAVRSGERWSAEMTGHRHDGVPIRMFVSVTPLRDSSGEPSGFTCVASDLTALEATEEALRERVKELRVLTRASEFLNLSELSLEERLERVVHAIPSGWQFPDRTEARLVLGDREIQTEGFQPSPWMQSVELETRDERGRLDVVLLEPGPVGAAGPFLPEEHGLLESLGRILTEAIDRASLLRLLTQTYASLQEAVLVIDSRLDGRGIRYANRAAEEMFGYESGGLLGRTTEVLHVNRENFLEFAEVGVPKLIADGTFFGDFPMRRRDGTSFFAEQTVSLLEPERGLEGGVVSVVRDVSDRTLAERRLLESEERFRQIAENIEDVFWVSSPDKNVMEYVSPAYEQIWGRPREELYRDPMSWGEAVVPGDRSRVFAAVSHQRQGIYEQEYRIARPDGEERWILDRSFPVRDAEGVVARVIGVAKDITEQRRIEERFGILSQEITDVIYVISREGTVLTSSPSVHGATGYLKAEFEGRSAFDFVHPEDREAVEARIQEVASEVERTERIEHRVIRRDGATIHVESVARNLLQDPAIQGILITSRDVTERFELERRVRQMQKMESVGRLAGGVAHDFNNLLTVIQSQTELILMELPPGEVADELGVIREAADRAAALTSQLLAFSRDQILRPRTLNLSGVVRGAGRMIQRMLGDDVRVIYDLTEPLPPVRIDPNQLEQVLFNLAVNARDAMGRGGDLTISTFTEELDADQAASLPGVEAAEYVVLAVSDTGVGMSEEVQQQIFEPFFTTKPTGQGTGLGLAMVYGTVRQSGGSVHVQSALGEGSTFFLRFPVVEGDSDEEAPAIAAMDEGSTHGSDISPRTVLVIEDQPPVRRAIVRVLDRAGIRVVEAGDAEEGLRVLESGEQVHGVLTDIGLPGMSGSELVLRLRESHPGLALIVMSGYAEGSPGDRVEIPEDVAFVQKPFASDVLVESVRKALRTSPKTE